VHFGLKAPNLVERWTFMCLLNMDMVPPRKPIGLRVKADFQNGGHFEPEVKSAYTRIGLNTLALVPK